LLFFSLHCNLFFVSIRFVLMPIQYLSDQTGRTTAVLIPIEEWEAITQRHDDLKKLLAEQAHTAPKAGRKELARAVAPPSRPKPSDYRGILSPELTEQLHQHAKEARQEWDRNSF
jgi:hypothetical protein